MLKGDTHFGKIIDQSIMNQDRVILNTVTHGMSLPHNECSMNVASHRVIVGTVSSHM